VLPRARFLFRLAILVLGLLSGGFGSGVAGAVEPERLTVSAPDRRTLVLERPRAASGETEGLVIDSDKLVRALKRRVLEARGLGEVAELESASGLNPFSRRQSAAEPSPYVFGHRFGPPFDGLDATLRLQPLAEPDDGSFLFPLAVLLATAVVLGLYALYRTTATQIEFAERRNNFVSAVSHELKTPLTAIRMYAEMLEDDLVGDEARRRDYYRTITAESERLSRLINNVLELSRIEKKPDSLKLVLGDVSVVVREALDVLRPHVEREAFTLELESADSLPNVYFEPDALKQILFNLIDNSLKYSRDAGERRITVRLVARAPNRVTLSVRDRGPGVHRAHLRAIFQPFFRGERELTRKNPGTGIGLALVQGLVERMGGTVRGENVDPGFEISVELTAG
jgi:signal transduction histidine kinase